jgi:SAM-dependent methyltransferase
MPDPASERHALQAGFDADAGVYQRTRPVCPARMFDDLVVEIGCGTGQATVPLAERGLAGRGVALPREGELVPRRSRQPALPVPDDLRRAGLLG